MSVFICHVCMQQDIHTILLEFFLIFNLFDNGRQIEKVKITALSPLELICPACIDQSNHFIQILSQFIQMSSHGEAQTLTVNKSSSRSDFKQISRFFLMSEVCTFIGIEIALPCKRKKKKKKILKSYSDERLCMLFTYLNMIKVLFISQSCLSQKTTILHLWSGWKLEHYLGEIAVSYISKIQVWNSVCL